MQQKWRMMLARFPYGGSERTELVDWCSNAGIWAQKQPDLDGGLKMWRISDTPVTMCRNKAVQVAIENNIDILVMVDNDMAPDIDRSHPFLPSAFKFIKSRWHTAPTIISAPYCMSGPGYAPVMGTWRTHFEGSEVRAAIYNREEAAAFKGILPCSLQGTGLMAIDMRIFTGFEINGEVVKLPPPYFYYQYTDNTNSEKMATEDMVFTANASLLYAKHDMEIGYVDWDAWAYHVKTEHVGKPKQVTVFTAVPLHEE
jgi:hypothetical protein